MKKKYKMVRFPAEAYDNFLGKKNVIQEILKEEKVKKKFTDADTLRYLLGKKTVIYNDELINFLNNRKSRRIRTKLI